MAYRVPRLACWLLAAVLVASAATACGAKRSLEIGQPVPDLRLPDAEGQEIALADLRGQVVLVNFWATWCKPCKEEMPIFQSLLDTYGEAGLAVVLVSLGDEPADVTEYMRDHGYTFVALIDSDGVVERVYGVDTLPTTWLIDSDGVLRDSWMGPVRDRDALEQQATLLLPIGLSGGTPTPAEAVASTATSPPLPKATPTSSPVATQSPTSTPTSTPSPSPTLSPTPTPIPPTPTDTPTPTPTPKHYPAPVLLSPDDGAQFLSDAYAELHWSWDGVLGEDEYFDVRVWREGAPHYGVAWTKEGVHAVKRDPDVLYHWAIAVIRGQDGQMLEQLSPESAARRLLWIEPTPTEPPPSYGLSLQCAETSKTAPPGELVVFGVNLVNTGSVQDAFDLSMSQALPGGWQGMFCIGDECYTGGVHSVTVSAGGTQLVEVKIKSAGDAQSGQAGTVTLMAVSHGDSSQRGSIAVTLSVQ